MNTLSISNSDQKNGDQKDNIEELFAFTMAFQPIVDVEEGLPYAYEALVRGPGGESAASILSLVTEENRYRFDQGCRVKAITLAAELGLAKTGARLAINFIPGAILNPTASLHLTLNTARNVGFPVELLIFEITETEKIHDRAQLRGIIDEYRRRGFKVALDDFGAGHAGLNLLAAFPPDILKLDMELTRNLHQRSAALSIVKHMAKLARSLGCLLVAEGVESVEEYVALRLCGIRYMQGYLFARPAVEALPAFAMPALLLPDFRGHYAERTFTSH